MNCMDIAKKLPSTDRAECWTLFSKLTKVFYIKNNLSDPRFAEIKDAANEMNLIFEKNGFEKYFNTGCTDEEFLNALLNELSEIRSSPRRED